MHKEFRVSSKDNHWTSSFAKIGRSKKIKNNDNVELYEKASITILVFVFFFLFFLYVI